MLSIALLLGKVGYWPHDFLAGHESTSGVPWIVLVSSLIGTIFVFFVPISILKRATLAVIHFVLMVFLQAIYLFLLMLLGILHSDL